MATIPDRMAQRILDRVREEDMTYAAACEAVGTTTSRLRTYRREHPAYDEELERARYSEYEEVPNRPGPKPSVTPQKAQQVLDVLANGETISHACELLGLSVWSLRRYRLEHPEYNDMIRTLLHGQVQLLWDSLFMEGMQGDVNAMKFFLVNRTRFLPADHPLKAQNLSKVDHTVRPPGEEEDQVSVDDQWRYDDDEQVARVVQLLQQHEPANDPDGSNPDGSDRDEAADDDAP